jgi:hypothetical protein
MLLNDIIRISVLTLCSYLHQQEIQVVFLADLGWLSLPVKQWLSGNIRVEKIDEHIMSSAHKILSLCSF